MKKQAIFFILFFFSIISMVLYAFFIEPKRIVTHNYTLGDNQGQKPLKVVQLSDIHIQENYPVAQLEKIVTKVNQEKPDIILFTGDLFDNYAKYGPAEDVTAALSRLTAPLGKFAVWGNHDYGGGAARVYPEILAGAGFQLLENSGMNIALADGKSVFISGLDDSLLGNSSIEEALSERQSEYTILLSHEPDVADQLVNQNIQLILSGHSHGGQINLPFITIKNIMAEKYFSGFYNLTNDTTLYVNTGLGTTKIPARFRVPPEIAVFDLYI
ncbi:metallophosphoesterase [Enterococcus sp. AZ192]|uniref:metallophosphoesterase n=1 Tax=unclassified Enterococcus TaxID=2608891 RepID=UPI003D2AB84E